MSQIPTLKIVIIGDGGCGKTTLVKRHQSGEFKKNYIATMGVEVSPLTFQTNKGHVILNIWDCAGQEKFSGLQSGYYIGANAYIVMFDLSSKVSYKNAKIWVSQICTHHKRFVGATPPLIVLCGNKVDIKDRPALKVDPHLHGKFKYYDISVKSNYNCEKPFLYIIRTLNELQTPDLPTVERVLPTIRD